MSFDNMSSSSKRSNWIDFYSKSSNIDPNRGAIWDSRYDICDKCVVESSNQEAELLNFFLSNQGYNFALIPSLEKGKIQCVHNCFVYEDSSDGSQSVFGIKGVHFSSPWKAIPSNQLVTKLRMPRVGLGKRHKQKQMNFGTCVITGFAGAQELTGPITYPTWVQ